MKKQSKKPNLRPNWVSPEGAIITIPKKGENKKDIPEDLGIYLTEQPRRKSAKVTGW